jgi:2-keto-3-deoxy-L-rhamnonate aldolase RhmA
MNVKEKASSGTVVCGTMIRFIRNSAIVCYAKHAGLDFFMCDCEHGAFTTETLHDLYMTAIAYGIEGFARVPVTTKDYISRILDCGASGIMTPMTETVKQAEELVYYSKYAPLGNRGFSSGANTGYKGGVHTEIMKEANSRIWSRAQIETALGVENAEKIAAVEGIDALLIGPNDLSLSLGIPGDLTNPTEIQAIKKVAAACKKHNKFFTVHSRPEYQDLFSGDMSFIMQMGEGEFLSAGFKSIKIYADKYQR